MPLIQPVSAGAACNRTEKHLEGYLQFNEPYLVGVTNASTPATEPEDGGEPVTRAEGAGARGGNERWVGHHLVATAPHAASTT